MPADMAFLIMLKAQLLKKFINEVKVANISFDKVIIRFVFNVLQICKITCISQFVQIVDFVIRILVYEQSNNVTSDEASASGDDDISKPLLIPLVRGRIDICIHNKCFF